jgi:anti-anti-sigma factor
MIAELQIQTIDQVKVIHLVGSLNQEGLAEIENDFRTAIAPIAGKAPRIVIDLEKVDAVTTPAITLFLSAVRSIQPLGGKVVFTGAHGITEDIFTRCRLDAIFTIAATVLEAVKLAQQGKK